MATHSTHRLTRQIVIAMLAGIVLGVALNLLGEAPWTRTVVLDGLLPVIVFALLLGIAVTMSGTRGKHVLNFFNDLDTVIMHMVEWVMRLAPYGVFALITRTFATQGPDLLLTLAACFLTLTAALAIQSSATCPLRLRLLASLNPITFLKEMRDPAVFDDPAAGSVEDATRHTLPTSPAT